MGNFGTGRFGEQLNKASAYPDGPTQAEVEPDAAESFVRRPMPPGAQGGCYAYLRGSPDVPDQDVRLPRAPRNQLMANYRRWVSAALTV